MGAKKKFYIFLSFVLISLLTAVLSGYFGINLSLVENFISINHYLAIFLYTILFTLLTTFAFSSNALIGMSALFFSSYEAIFYSMIGIMASSIIDFYISRKLGRNYVRNYLEKHGGALEKFDEILEKDTFKTLLILSIIFFVPRIIPNLLGGIVKINLKKYALATFLGNLPTVICIVYLINGISYSNYLQIYASVAGLVLVSLVAIYFYKGEMNHILRLSFPWMFRR